MKGSRELDQVIEAELARWPEVRWRMETGSKHRRLFLEANGKSRFVICPGSPGCRRGLKNKVRDIRREIERLGVRQNG